MKPHKHADMIKAWADNPSRPVCIFLPFRNIWQIENPPLWDEDFKYCFSDEVRGICDSPLNDDEIERYVEEYSCYVSPADHWSFKQALRAVANAAHIAAIKQVCGMKPTTSLSHYELCSLLDKNDYEDTQNMQRIIIGQFLCDVKRKNSIK